MGAHWKCRQLVLPAIVWALLFAWSWTAFGQAGGDQPAGEQPPAPTAMTTPAMTGPLAANPNPMWTPVFSDLFT